MEDTKSYMFQYATQQKIFEDTGLVTLSEAQSLWDKYQQSIREEWNEFSRPHMCIWQNCNSVTDYGDILKEIDYFDCELENGVFYKITKIIIH